MIVNQSLEYHFLNSYVVSSFLDLKTSRIYDGVKIDFPDKWVHLRKSNTEPIIRVYSEASTMEAADEIGQKIMDVVYSLAK